MRGTAVAMTVLFVESDKEDGQAEGKSIWKEKKSVSGIFSSVRV